MTAAAHLRTLAADLADFPATALDRLQTEAERVVAAAAPVSSMRGHKRAGLPVRMAHNQHPVLGDPATFRVQGTVPGWLWLDSGTRPHRIPRGRRWIRHPGSRGRHAWRRVKVQIGQLAPKIVRDEMSKVLR